MGQSRPAKARGTVTLTEDEVSVLREVISRLVVRDRTGELGIPHGLGRFVSTHLRLKKTDRVSLDAAARKIGLDGVLTVDS
jgi:hypothetical protein